MSDRDNNPLDDDDDGSYDFLGRVDLDDEGLYQADVYKSEDAEEPDELHLDLEGMLDLLGVDINDQDVLLDLLTQRVDNFEDTGLDAKDKDFRGGYDREEIIKFLNETGWWGIADVFYDAEFDEYYININYEG